MHLFSLVTFLATGGFFVDLYVTGFGFPFSNDQTTVGPVGSSIIDILLSDRLLIWLVILLILVGWWDVKMNLRNHDVKLDKTVRLTALDVARNSAVDGNGADAVDSITTESAKSDK